MLEPGFKRFKTDRISSNLIFDEEVDDQAQVTEWSSLMVNNLPLINEDFEETKVDRTYN